MMVEASLIFRILMVMILVAFAIVFALLSFYDRKNLAPRWIATSYVLGLGAFLADLGRTPIDPIYMDVVAKICLSSVSIAWTIGIAHHFKAKVPAAPLSAIALLGLVPLCWFSFVQPDVIMRSIFATCTAGFLLMAGLPILWRNSSNLPERFLMVLITILCSTYFIRPIVAFGLLGDFHTTANYDSSLYAAMLHSMSAVLGLACGITMTLAIGQTIIERHFLASIRDPLTGLLNRRGLEQHVNMRSAEGLSDDGAILMVDLDNFKSINDRFGHDVGDQVLKRTAALLGTLTEGLGEIARIGGEEFLVLLGKMDDEDRMTVAQHLRLSVGMIEHPELPAGECVTASLGMARLSPTESFSMTMRKADQCMYQAKEAGRNRVVFASEKNIKPDLQLVQRK